MRLLLQGVERPQHAEARTGSLSRFDRPRFVSLCRLRWRIERMFTRKGLVPAQPGCPLTDGEAWRQN